MRVSLIIQAVLLLAASVYSAQYIPLHKRFTYTDEIDDFSYLGLLSRRDVCSEAFGSSAYNSECKPDKTLCCPSTILWQFDRITNSYSRWTSRPGIPFMREASEQRMVLC